jgi:hypothetical protein
LFCLWPALADSAAPSLLFTDLEVTAIEAARQGLANGAPEASASPPGAPGEIASPSKPHMPNVHVSAVLDLGAGRWTVWANGYRITPDRQPPQFKILSVAGNSVEIAVAGDNPARVRLHANQTWRVRQRDIVEGTLP